LNGDGSCRRATFVPSSSSRIQEDPLRKFIVTVLASGLALSAVAVAEPGEGLPETGAAATTPRAADTGSGSKLSMYLVRNMSRAEAAGFCSGHFETTCHDSTGWPCERLKRNKIECQGRAEGVVDDDFCTWVRVFRQPPTAGRRVIMELSGERVCTA
jgi:hypothetical protein